MSKRASQGATLTLVRVLKELSRQWRSGFNSGFDGADLTEWGKKYFGLPIWTFIQLIAKSTGFYDEDLKYVAWFSDRALERTPSKPPGPFKEPDPDPIFDGLPEDYLNEHGREYLRSVYDEFAKCDNDGRTAEFLKELEAKHPGALDGLRAEANGKQVGEQKRRRKTKRPSTQAKGKPRQPIKKKTAPAPRKPEGPRVVLGGPADQPSVHDNVKDQLTMPQYDVVKALLEAGEQGLTKDELDRKSGHGDARKILKRLADKDEDWKSVIHFPGTTGRRYRIS